LIHLPFCLLIKLDLIIPPKSDLSDFSKLLYNVGFLGYWGNFNLFLSFSLLRVFLRASFFFTPLEPILVVRDTRVITLLARQALGSLGVIGELSNPLG
jgi:hypothetical protein